MFKANKTTKQTRQARALLQDALLQVTGRLQPGLQRAMALRASVDTKIEEYKALKHNLAVVQALRCSQGLCSIEALLDCLRFSRMDGFLIHTMLRI